VLALSVLFLSHGAPLWVRGAGAGAGGAVAAVAAEAARGLIAPSFQRVRGHRSPTVAWAAYLLAGAAGVLVFAPGLVLVLLGCGLLELVRRQPAHQLSSLYIGPLVLSAVATASAGIAALAWTAFKVGALSFGGGFVIIPLMQGDAVHTYHWMSNGQFLNAVALGQITPGPVVATIAAVGYAAHGLDGGLLAAAVAFAPSFSFIMLLGGRFQRLRQNTRARAFLDGAGPAAIGAILGSAIALAGALSEVWQYAVLAAAAVALLTLRRGVVPTLLAAGVVGIIAALAGAPLP
jgi:chromate transporter